jgi:hypothetical protein
MRRPTVQDASRRTHNNKFRHHEAANDRFGRPAEHRRGLQQRTIARATRKSGESRRIRGHTYCPGAAIRALIWRMPVYKSTSVVLTKQRGPMGRKSSGLRRGSIRIPDDAGSGPVVIRPQ